MDDFDFDPASLVNSSQTTEHELHPDASRKVVSLRCCCCGVYTRGRQFSNQDKGFGLGSCCVEFVKPRVKDMEATYGLENVHYFAPKPTVIPAPKPPEPLRR